MTSRVRAHLALVAVAATALAAPCTPAAAQDTIKIGELNSYKSQPGLPRAL